MRYAEVPKLCVISDCTGVKHPPKALPPALTKTQLVKNPVTSGKDILILISQEKQNLLRGGSYIGATIYWVVY